MVYGLMGYVNGYGARLISSEWSLISQINCGYGPAQQQQPVAFEINEGGSNR